MRRQAALRLSQYSERSTPTIHTRVDRNRLYSCGTPLLSLPDTAAFRRTRVQDDDSAARHASAPASEWTLNVCFPVNAEAWIQPGCGSSRVWFFPVAKISRNNIVLLSFVLPMVEAGRAGVKATAEASSERTACRGFQRRDRTKRAREARFIRCLTPIRIECQLLRRACALDVCAQSSLVPIARRATRSSVPPAVPPPLARMR